MNRRKSQAFNRARRFTTPAENPPEVDSTFGTDIEPRGPAPETTPETTPAETFHCPECGREFASARSLASHKGRAHKAVAAC